MSFATLDQIKPFVNAGVYSALASGSNFSLIAAQADIEIENLTGIEIPTDSSSSPDWIIYPVAKIIQFMAYHLLQSTSEELYGLFKQEYDLALSNISKHPQEVNTDRSTNQNIDIGGLYEW